MAITILVVMITITDMDTPMATPTATITAIRTDTIMDTITHTTTTMNLTFTTTRLNPLLIINTPIPLKNVDTRLNRSLRQKQQQDPKVMKKPQPNVKTRMLLS